MNLLTSICHHQSLMLRRDVALTPSPLTTDVKFCSFQFYPRRFIHVTFAKKNKSQQPVEPIIKPSIVEEIYLSDEDEIDEDFEDDMLLDDDDDDDDGDDFDDEYFEEEAETYVGDGAGGGGFSLAGTGWDKNALEIAEEVALSFDGELGIYAFKTLPNATVQVRVERLTNKSGSPNMTDIEEFSRIYRTRLDEAESTGSIPPNLSLEVSSPGVERVLRIPQDLDRFKERNMYVKYAAKVEETGSMAEYDGVFRLISFDKEASFCTWGLADVRVNREKAGKGRPLNKKQRDWRLDTPFDSLRLVRLHSEV